MHGVLVQRQDKDPIRHVCGYRQGTVLAAHSRSKVVLLGAVLSSDTYHQVCEDTHIDDWRCEQRYFLLTHMKGEQLLSLREQTGEIRH